MKLPKKEHEQAQAKILKFLFDKGEAARIEELCQVIPSPKSETEYHCDVLLEKGWIRDARLPLGMTSGEGPVSGFVITAGGRKHVMENGDSPEAGPASAA